MLCVPEVVIGCKRCTEGVLFRQRPRGEGVGNPVVDAFRLAAGACGAGRLGTRWVAETAWPSSRENVEQERLSENVKKVKVKKEVKGKVKKKTKEKDARLEEGEEEEEEEEGEEEEEELHTHRIGRRRR